MRGAVLLVGGAVALIRGQWASAALAKGLVGGPDQFLGSLVEVLLSVIGVGLEKGGWSSASLAGGTQGLLPLGGWEAAAWSSLGL